MRATYLLFDFLFMVFLLFSTFLFLLVHSKVSSQFYAKHEDGEGVSFLFQKKKTMRTNTFSFKNFKIQTEKRKTSTLNDFLLTKLNFVCVLHKCIRLKVLTRYVKFRNIYN